MSTARDALSASLVMVDFLQKYTATLTKQIEAIQQQMDASVSGVMTAVQDLSMSTEAKKQEAERVLEQTYLAPDAGTAVMVDSIQKSTDDIFEQASKALAGDQPSQQLSPAATDDRGAEIRRMGGLFSKHMESISTLDDSVKDIVMGMVGSMSNNDVVKQRLDHINVTFRAMHVGIANILVDLDKRLSPAVIREFRENLLEYVYKSYTTEQERNAFKQVFGASPSVLRAYNAGTGTGR